MHAGAPKQRVSATHGWNQLESVGFTPLPQPGSHSLSSSHHRQQGGARWGREVLPRGAAGHAHTHSQHYSRVQLQDQSQPQDACTCPDGALRPLPR